MSKNTDLVYPVELVVIAEALHAAEMLPGELEEACSSAERRRLLDPERQSLTFEQRGQDTRARLVNTAALIVEALKAARERAAAAAACETAPDREGK